MNEQRFSELAFKEEDFIKAIQEMFVVAHECRVMQNRRERLRGRPSFKTDVAILDYLIDMDGVMIPFLKNGRVYRRAKRCFGLWHKKVLILRYDASYTWMAGGGGTTQLEPATFFVTQDFAGMIAPLTSLLKDLLNELNDEVSVTERSDSEYVKEYTSLVFLEEDEDE